MSEPAGTPSRIKLLHVDDEESQLEAVREMIKEYDPLIDVRSMNSPIEALKLLENEYFDCLVTDFKMPYINGIEFSKKVRAKKNLPIILYTGQGSEEVAEAAFLAGVNDYIKKEIDPHHYHILAKRIRDLVEKSRIDNLYINVVEDAREAIGIIILDKIVYSNNALVELLGEKKLGDVIGKNFFEYILPQEREHIKDSIMNIQTSGEISQYYQTIIKKRDGNKISSEISVSMINFRGHKAILNFVRDVSGRKKLEDEIKKSEERFRNMVNLAPDGIAITNLTGEVTWINPSFTKILGFPEDEIIGKSFLSFGSMKASQNYVTVRIFQDLANGQSVPPFEFQWKRRDGKIGFGEAHLSLVKLGNESQEVLVFTRDVTRRNKIKEELEIYSKELEHLVQQKTSNLIDSEKMIAAGKLTNLIAQNLRDPLATIKNAVKDIQNNSENKENLMQRINEAINASIQILDELRTKTRYVPLQIEEKEIQHLINEVIDKTPIPPKVNLIFEIENVKAEFDIHQMSRVIQNIIENSLDAMNEKGEILISTKITDGMLKISITDNGSGMNDEVIANLFKPFYTTKPGHTGLGLSYSKRIVESHRGKLEVRSSFGKGTTISVYLPLIASRNEEVALTSIPFAH
ncbi:MAG: PAS domain S-box protein [Candidatus Bathyarchaeia archaeon]|jgi:two-component system sporulation sensor kinase A